MIFSRRAKIWTIRTIWMQAEVPLVDDKLCFQKEKVTWTNNRWKKSQTKIKTSANWKQLIFNFQKQTIRKNCWNHWKFYRKHRNLKNRSLFGNWTLIQSNHLVQIILLIRKFPKRNSLVQKMWLPVCLLILTLNVKHGICVKLEESTGMIFRLLEILKTLKIIHLFRTFCFKNTMISFLCANGTVFNERSGVCDWWYNVDCTQSQLNIVKMTTSKRPEVSIPRSVPVVGRRSDEDTDEGKAKKSNFFALSSSESNLHAAPFVNSNHPVLNPISIRNRNMELLNAAGSVVRGLKVRINGYSLNRPNSVLRSKTRFYSNWLKARSLFESKRL